MFGTGPGGRRAVRRPSLPGLGPRLRQRRRRARRVLHPGRTATTRASPEPRTLGALAAGLAVVVLVGLPFGPVFGLAATPLAHRLLGALESASRRQERRRRRADLPIALDLLAECLRAGLPMTRALAVVGPAVGGPVSADLGRVATLCRLGASARAAWTEVRGDRDLGPVARAVDRSSDSGAALSEVFHRSAACLRTEAVLAGRARADRAGVLVMMPLGLCFLPAFVCLGVVPVVLGVASQVLH